MAAVPRAGSRPLRAGQTGASPGFPTTQLLGPAASWLMRLAEPSSLATRRSRSVMGTAHSQRTGSPPNEKPDRLGGSGPASPPGSSSSRTASYPAPSGNVEGSWYQRTLCPGPNQVTARHGYGASHRNTRAASAAGMVVAMASSLRAYWALSWTRGSTPGIRWQLMPTVDSTV